MIVGETKRNKTPSHQPRPTNSAARWRRTSELGGCRISPKGAMRRICEGWLPLKADNLSNPEQPEPPRVQPQNGQLKEDGGGTGGKAPFAFPPAALVLSTRESTSRCRYRQPLRNRNQTPFCFPNNTREEARGSSPLVGFFVVERSANRFIYCSLLTFPFGVGRTV